LCFSTVAQATPLVNNVSPTSGAAGTPITFTGTGFGSSQGSGNVWLGSTYGSVVSWSDTQVVATVASGAKSGTAQILQDGVWSNPISFTVATPVVSSVTPSSGFAGTQVTFTGSGFGSSQGSGNAWLGSTYGTVVSWSDTQVVATVAAGAKSGTAQILQGGVWSDPINFSVVTPIVASVSPTSGIAGTQVTFTGTGFGTTQGSGNVWLGSTYGIVVSWSDTQVVATVAAGSKSGTAQILQGGVWSDVINFTVVTPVVTSVTPTSGIAGTQVTFTGTGFGATQGSGNVWLGSTYGTVVSWSDTQVVATVAAGAKSGTAQILQGGVWSDVINFTVVTPVVSSVTPATGTAGTQVTFTGTGFGATQGNGNVWLGSTYGAVVSWSDTQVVATVASGAKSGTAQILQGGVWSDVINFTVVTPVVSSVTPTSGIAGTQVTFTGTGFGASQAGGNVWLGSTYGTIVSWSDTQVVATIASGAKSGTAQILQGGVWSDPISFSVITPVVSSVTPSDGLAGTQVTFTGTGFGATQGSGNVWLGSTYGTVVSWSDTQVVATVAQGATSGTAQILQGGVWSDPINFRVDSTGPLLQFSVADTPLQVNLTSSQNLDWIHWGRVSATLPDRKGGITPLISDYTAVSGAPSASSGNIGFSWTDEYNQAAVSETLADVETFAANGGFQITVPADTSVKTLRLYVEVFTGQGQLQASLSDGSAAAISDQSVIDSDIASKVYSIDFRAGSPNQTLTVTFTSISLNTVSGVGLQAATLTQHLPVVSITSPVAGQSLAVPGTIQFNATATQFDYPISDIHATGSDSTVLDSPASPLATNWGPLAAGHYSITASATDSMGLTNTSAPVETDVIGQGGSLSIEENAPSSPIDLDAQGSGDWVLWGPVNTGDLIFNNPGNLLARKSGVAPLISDYKLIGNHGVHPLASSHSLQFTSASQTFSAAGSEIGVFGLKDGFEITVPADTTPRTLQLYAGVISGDFSVTAFLSDGSAPVATEVGGTGPPPPPPQTTTLYSINYSAASSGQTLTVRLTLGADQGGGEAALIAAALNGPSVAPTVPAPQITAINPASAPANARVTITGTNFGATQGDSSVLFGQISAQVVSWSDTSIVVTVPAGLRDGSTTPVVVFTDNGTSNAVNFTTPAFKLYPPSLSLVVGQTASVTPKDSSGNPVTGITWTTKDPTIVRLSSDDPPLITALAVGSATVYAGDVTLPVTVYPGTSLPPGTVLWSVPLGGSGEASIAPAVPSDSGADVFALDDTGTLTALASDGTPVWSVSGIPGGSAGKIIPDFSGNAMVKTPYTSQDTGGNLITTSTVQMVDRNTRKAVNLYTFQTTINAGAFGVNPISGASIQNAIPGPSGQAFIQDLGNVVVMDPATGQTLGTASLDASTVNGVEGGFDFQSVLGTQVGPMIVAGDGNAYVPYAYTVETHATTYVAAVFPVTTHIDFYSMLLRVAPDGSSTKTQLRTWTYDRTCVPWTPPNHSSADGAQCTNTDSAEVTNTAAIANADQGAAVFTTTLKICAGTSFFNPGGFGAPDMTGSECADTKEHTEAAYVSQDAVTSSAQDVVVLPNDDGRFQAFVPVLQREDGSYIGTDTLPNAIWAGSRLIAVSGTSMLWNQNVGPAFDPTSNATTAPFLMPLYATDGGGLIIRSAQKNNCQTSPPQCTTVSSTLYTVDPSGNVTDQAADSGAKPSWTGYWYSDGPVRSLALDSLDFAPFCFPVAGGNPSNNQAAIKSIKNRFFRQKIADNAASHLGDSQNWNERGKPAQCNQFVHDVLQATFGEAPDVFHQKLKIFSVPVPAVAADWADPGKGPQWKDVDGSTPFACWKIIPEGPDGAKPGDILATGWPQPKNPDGTGHVGIVVAPVVVTSANPQAPGISVTTKLVSSASVAPWFWAASQQASFQPGTIDQTDYGFRLAIGPNTYGNQGLKQDSHVRRFVCY
jgi:hypothetical protein